MTKIKFEKTIQKAELRSPFRKFKTVTQLIEIRKDPLTGRRCRINVERTKRLKQVPTETAELRETIESSRAKCYFCPENIERATPMFVGNLPSRIMVGKACVFPNLFPFGSFHAVGVFSGDHYLELNQFTPKLLEDCFKACLMYFKHVYSEHEDLKYWHINWNHLSPAAASIVHPHVQIMADSEPTPYLLELIERSRLYHDRNMSNYWLDLVEAELAKGERFIGGIGSVRWLASFAPQGNREVMAVFSDASALASIEGRRQKEFCEGLSRILKGYHALGVQSFNMATFSGPCGEDMSDFYLLNVRVISRPTPAPFYTSDNGFMEKLHHEPVIEVLPEQLSKKMREFF